MQHVALQFNLIACHFLGVRRQLCDILRRQLHNSASFPLTCLAYLLMIKGHIAHECMQSTQWLNSLKQTPVAFSAPAVRCPTNSPPTHACLPVCIHMPPPTKPLMSWCYQWHFKRFKPANM